MMTETEKDDLRGQILLQEHQIRKELQAYIVKIEKVRERLDEISNCLRKFTGAVEPSSALTDEAGRYASWAGIDLHQTGEDCQKALQLRQNLESIKIQKTRLDL